MHIHELGQTIITGISGLQLNQDERDFLKENNIGGVILFKHNFESPAQLAELCNDIQKCRSEYPLFISVDQEGGRVKRFQSGFTQFPSMKTVGDTNSPKLTFEVHKIIAQELKSCGVNINFSPCCDVFTNPNNKVIGDRAFSTNNEEVEKHISAAIRGLHTGGVLACPKHFPGHGDTTKDSHYDLPYVTKSLEELKKLELTPFHKASKARSELLMMSHLVVDAIDPKFPCTLSKKAYDFCRQELKYKNIIITDDMEMKAIEDHFTTPEAAVMALDAGADILIYRTMEKAQMAYEGLTESVKTQKLKRSVVEERIKQVARCKKGFLSEFNPVYIPDIEKKFPNLAGLKILEELTSRP